MKNMFWRKNMGYSLAQKQRLRTLWLCCERKIRPFWACREEPFRVLCPESFCAWKVATQKVLGFCASGGGRDKRVKGVLILVFVIWLCLFHKPKQYLVGTGSGLVTVFVTAPNVVKFRPGAILYTVNFHLSDTYSQQLGKFSQKSGPIDLKFRFQA